VIGKKTYGKALIQRSYSLSDGSKIKFTVGEFVPEDGTSYNGKGIIPDLEVEPGFKNAHDYYFLTPDTDKTMQAAVEYMNQLS